MAQAQIFTPTEHDSIMALKDRVGWRFSLVLQHLEDQRQMNQTDVASFLGVTQSRVSKWTDYDKKQFSAVIRRKLEKLSELGINPKYFDNKREAMLLKDRTGDPAEIEEEDPEELRKELIRLKAENLELERQLFERKRDIWELIYQSEDDRLLKKKLEEIKKALTE